MKGFVLSEADSPGFWRVSINIRVDGWDFRQLLLEGSLIQRAGKSGGVSIGGGKHGAKLYDAREPGDRAVLDATNIAHFVAIRRECRKLETAAFGIASLDAAQSLSVFGVLLVVIVLVVKANSVNPIAQVRLRSEKLAAVMVKTALYVRKVSAIERAGRDGFNKFHTLGCGQGSALSIELSSVAKYHRFTAVNSPDFKFGIGVEWVKMLVAVHR